MEADAMGDSDRLDHRAAVLAQNESRFRDINERLERDLQRLDADVEERFPFVCECGRNACSEAIALTFAEYEAVRADALHFAIVPGHEYPEVEDVLHRKDEYWVVRKHERTRPIVERSDHRGG